MRRNSKFEHISNWAPSSGFPDCLLMFKKFRVVHGNHMFSQSKKLTRIIFQKTWFVVLLGKECACSVSLMSSTGLLLDCATSQALPGQQGNTIAHCDRSGHPSCNSLGHAEGQKHPGKAVLLVTAQTDSNLLYIINSNRTAT